MADRESGEVDENEVVDAEANHGEGDVLDDTINDIFHPMITEVGSESHLFHGVVNFVKFPEKGDVVEEAVNVPLNEVAQNEEGKELSPGGPASDLEGDEVIDSDECQ